jgi:hypothetical protein
LFTIFLKKISLVKLSFSFYDKKTILQNYDTPEMINLQQLFLTTKQHGKNLIQDKFAWFYFRQKFQKSSTVFLLKKKKKKKREIEIEGKKKRLASPPLYFIL